MSNVPRWRSPLQNLASAVLVSIFGASAHGQVEATDTGRIIADGGTPLVLTPAGVDAIGRAVYGPIAPDPRVPREQQLFLLTDMVLFEVDVTEDVVRLAEAFGVSVVEERLISGRRFVALRARDIDHAQHVVEVAQGQRHVHSASPVVARWLTPHAEPLQGDQWHLNNTGQSGGTVGEDANLTGAWGQGFTGLGTLINIVDGGVEVTHPDLAAGYVAAQSFDHVDGDADPSPVGLGDNHGTAVAGVVGARLNGVGVVGAAYNAQFAVQRLIGGPVTDLQIASALDHQGVFDIVTNSWGFTPGWYRDMPPIVAATIQDGIDNGRGGLGTIYVFSAGNAANFGGNANQVRWVNLRETICVSATDDEGKAEPRSSQGACIVVNAPSGGVAAGITTTDRTGVDGYDIGDYTSNFTETSAAAPIVAGVVALMLEANPNLNWRDVQHILALTADRNDPTDPSWFQNSVGNWYSEKYGFGRVNADAAVTAATSWVGLDASFTVSTASQLVQQGIPDGDVVGVEHTVNVTGTGINALEWVEVEINLTAIRRGDTHIELTSPAGTKSILTTPNTDPSMNLNHIFTSMKSWGEPVNGIWKVRVIDPTLPSGPANNVQLDPTFWSSFRLRFHGTAAGLVTQFVVTGDPLGVAEGNTGELDVALTNGSLGDVDATLEYVSGDTDLQLVSANPVVFSASDWFVPRTIRFFAQSDPDNDNGSALWKISAPGIPERFFTVTESDGDATLRFVVLSQNPMVVTEGSQRDVEIRMTQNPGEAVLALTQRTSGDTDLVVAAGETLIFDQFNWAFPQRVSIQANSDADFLNGTASFSVTAANAGPTTFVATEFDVNDAPVYVLNPPGPYFIPEGTTMVVEVTMSGNPSSGTFAVAEFVTNDPDLRLIGGTNVAFSPNNFFIPQTLLLRADQDADTISTVAIFRIRAETAGFTNHSVSASEVDDDEDMTLFAESPPHDLTADQAHDFFVTINPGTNIVTPGSQRLFWRYDNGPFLSQTMLAVATTRFRATLPPPSCEDRVEFYVGAVGDFTGTLTDPPGGAATPFIALVGTTASIMTEDFSTDTGWTVSGIVGGGAAGPGPWERGNPADVGTLFNTPPSDFDGTNSCFITGNSLLAAVSGGQTILTSPTFNLGFTDGIRLSYARWLTESSGEATTGVMQVDISSNGGSTWAPLETVPAGAPGWTVREFELSGIVDSFANFRVRFSVNNSDILTALEGGIDAVHLDIASCGTPCAGDVDGSGMVNLDDLQLLLFAFGTTVPPGFGPDLAGMDGIVNLADLQILLFNFGGVCGVPIAQ